jgi:integrase/recombinase XerD
MGLTKQAKTLNAKQVNNVLARARDYRNGLRNETIVQLTLLAGLRAKEVAGLRWEHVLTSEGEIGNEIRLTNDAAKGKSGGVIPLHPKLKALLGELKGKHQGDAKRAVIRSEHGGALKAQSVVNLLCVHYQRCDIEGASSHSGRRTFVTNAARKISMAGGTIRDVQALARHANLATTQRYIETNSAAQRAVIDLL